MRVIILSDLHGNLSAVESVIRYIEGLPGSKSLLLLGDLVDYGMHSNEVIDKIRSLPYPIVCSIRGNHEQAILTGDFSRFSSERGKSCAGYTKSVLSTDSVEYIEKTMPSGVREFEIDGKKCLAVHGSLEDVYWKSIRPGQDLSGYRKYDWVFSGHSHLPHFFEVFFDADNPDYRNKKKTGFINPGSVGQPRNHNPLAQFAILDTDTDEVRMIKVAYDIEKEQEAYAGQVDEFYKTRLETGI